MRLDPGFVEAHTNLGAVLLDLGHGRVERLTLFADFLLDNAEMLIEPTH